MKNFIGKDIGKDRSVEYLDFKNFKIDIDIVYSEL